MPQQGSPTSQERKEKKEEEEDEEEEADKKKTTEKVEVEVEEIEMITMGAKEQEEKKPGEIQTVVKIVLSQFLYTVRKFCQEAKII